MDPTQALNDLRELIKQFEGGDISLRAIHAIVDTFTGLDEWLSTGGFLPGQWSENREVN